MMEPILTPAGEAALIELFNYLSIIAVCLAIVWIADVIIERCFNE
jgi:hypothetical protein